MIGPGNQVCVTHQAHPAFDHCGTVLAYNVSASETRIELKEELSGTRIGNIPRRTITKNHGVGGVFQ